ncbi:putative RhoGAP group protein [Sordaria brevicollis]|uniref:RhoGAP group protein n=1 Tax=Sordaria brevicollis TaxID=83679 RepID=A0AAE0UCF0_SORBR|nr:putative RhoGAP group protein [Sordaria brevicollis]
MQNHHYETDHASVPSVGTRSTPKSYLPRRVPNKGQTDEASSTWHASIPQSATAGQLPDPGGPMSMNSKIEEALSESTTDLLASMDSTYFRPMTIVLHQEKHRLVRTEEDALQLVHSAKRDVLKDEDLQSLVRLCGKSMFYLPSEYAPSSLILPTCLRATAQYLVQHATETRGVFRIPGSVRVVNALYDYYCTEGDPDQVSSTTRCPSLPVHIKAGVHDVASAFKRLLSGLPGGIFGSLAFFDAMVSIRSQLEGDPEATKTKQTKLRARLIALAIGSVRSQLRRELICAVFGLLCLIGRVAETAPREDEYGRPLPTADLMGYNALGIVFGPLLVGDLLNSYSMRSSSVHLIVSPVSPIPNSKWERRKHRTPEEAMALCLPNMDKVHVANSIAEMLITHWREVVKQMRSLDVLRVVGSGISDHQTPRRASLRASISEPFICRKPPEWQQSGPQTGTFQVSASPVPPSPTPEPRGRGSSGGPRTERLRPALVIPRQRPRSSRSLSRNRLSTPGPVVVLSPTEEEPSGSGASLSKRQSNGSLTYADETPSRHQRHGQHFGSEYVERKQTGSPAKLRTGIPGSQTPQTIRRRGGLSKSSPEGCDTHSLDKFRDRKGNKSQGDAPMSVLDEPMTKIPALRSRGVTAEDSELTPKPSARAPSHDRTSISSGLTDATGTPPDGKTKVKSSGHRLSRFPGWRWRERSEKSSDLVEPIAEPPSPITASSGRSSRQKGRRRLSFHLRRPTTAASMEEPTGQQVFNNSHVSYEQAGGTEQTPKPSVKSHHYSGGPLSHFATLSRATGRIARVERSHEAPSRPTTAHDQSHAKSRARSLASKIPRARRSDRLQTQRSSHESTSRSTTLNKNTAEHTLAFVPSEVQHEEDRINPRHEERASQSRPSTALDHDRITDYNPSPMSHNEDLRPPTTPKRPTSYYSKSFTGSAVRAMAAIFETAAAKDKNQIGSGFLPMPTKMTGNVFSHYTVNALPPQKPLSSPFETPDKGTVHPDGRRDHHQGYVGSPRKRSSRGSHDGVDDEVEAIGNLSAAMGQSSKHLNETTSGQQSHEPHGRFRGTTTLFGEKIPHLHSTQVSEIRRPSSAPTGAPDGMQISRVPMETSPSNTAILGDILEFQAQIRRLQRQLDIKTEENDHLRRKLVSFSAGQCSLPKDVSVRRSASIKLSEHLRQTERECKAWKERAEAAEMRVAILERLLRSKMDGKSYEEERATNSKVKSPSTSQHTFTADVYRSSGTVRDRLRKLGGVLDGCSESEFLEELDEEQKEGEEGTVRCNSVSVWSDGDDGDHEPSGDETESNEDKRYASQEKQSIIQQALMMEEDDSEGVVPEQVLDLLVSDLNGMHPNDPGEEDGHEQPRKADYLELPAFSGCEGWNVHEQDAAGTPLPERLAQCSDISVRRLKACKSYDDKETWEEEEGEATMHTGKRVLEEREIGEEEEKRSRECSRHQFADITEHADMHIE